MSEIFLDASYAIALSSSRDHHHRRAAELAEWLEANNHRLLTTRAVVVEIGNALSRSRYRSAAVTLLHSIESDPDIEIVPLTEELYGKALQLYAARQDKEWGLTDCLSFVVMGERGLTQALTTDTHFQQAGFQTLLLQ